MHEVAIAQEILDIVDQTARQYKAERVTLVKLRIGKFTSIVRDALDFALEALKVDTLSRDARFEIETVALHTRCLQCRQDFPEMEDYQFICSECGGTLEILAGRELEIATIDVDIPDEAQAVGGK